MPGIELPGEGQLPPGPLRALIAEVHDLYRNSGNPSTRVISSAIQGRDDFPDTVSHDLVSLILRGKVLPKWSKLEVLVRFLVERSVQRPDLDATLRRVHELWIAADKEKKETETGKISKEELRRAGIEVSRDGSVVPATSAVAQNLQEEMWGRWKEAGQPLFDSTGGLWRSVEYVHDLPTIPVPPPGTALLVVRYGAFRGSWYPLIPGRRIIIGRHPECEIALDDNTVSRRHAEINTRGVDFSVRDVGSTNGTWLNRERLAEEAILRPGDELQTGKFRFAFLAPRQDDDVS